jgi:hypothetical protein
MTFPMTRPSACPPDRRADAGGADGRTLADRSHSQHPHPRRKQPVSPEYWSQAACWLLESSRMTDPVHEIVTLLEGPRIFDGLVTAGTLLASPSVLPSTERAQLLGLLHERIRLVPAESVEDAEQAADARLHRIARVAAAPGDDYEVEEIVLVLTLRIEVALATFAAHELGLERWRTVSHSSDEAITSLARGKRSREAYRSAIALIEKNWRSEVPFDVDLLGLEAIWRAAVPTR